MLCAIIIGLFGLLINRDLIMKWFILIEVFTILIGFMLLISIDDVISLGLVLFIMLMGTFELVLGLLIVISF